MEAHFSLAYHGSIYILITHFLHILIESKPNCEIQHQNKRMELAALNNSKACVFQEMVSCFSEKS